MRLFLALWLALFTVQATGLVAAVVPDACVEDTSESTTDSCPPHCARCVCCSRASVFMTQAIVSASSHVATVVVPVSTSDRSTSAVARSVFHVPKAL